ncbi:MAG TPA: sugar porter family MFS transporter [Gaiellales bacterium]|nr:sugar porter family MFS transporter [Gaiellales bacterium]
MATTLTNPTAEAPHRRSLVVKVAAVTMLAGLLFGYDQGVISGALDLIKADLHLGTFSTEVITSWVTLGALGGALVAGNLADTIGRRHTAMTAGVLFAIGALFEAAAPGVFVLTFGRVLTGVAVGFASTVAPLYAAEMAPASVRGRVVSGYQLAITIGIFLAYLVNDLLQGSAQWRVMFAAAVVPGVLLVLGFMVVPESVRFLVKTGRREQARAVIEEIEGHDDAPQVLRDIEQSLATEREEGRASWHELLAPGLRRPLVIGVGLSVIQQVTGINAIIYYANDIFAKAGFESRQAQSDATLFAIGMVNVLATFIAIAYVDRFGRKPLLRWGLVGMFASLCLVGLAFAEFSSSSGGVTAGGVLTVIGLVVFIASFAFSLGPVVWTVISEIYPSRSRGRAVSIATAANWGAAFLVTQFFLTIVDAIGQAETFFLFAAICAVSYVWISRAVPETRGRTLEEIQTMFGLDPGQARPPATSG